MTTHRNWRRYLRFWGPDIEGDIDDELRFHLAMLEREYRERGMDASAARKAALDRFGDVSGVRNTLRDHDQRRLRQTRRIEFFDELFQDVRYGIRKLAAQRTFTLAIVTVLALGIGATTAIFSAVDAAMLRPLPFQRPEELVTIAGFDVPFRPPGEFPRYPKSAPDLADLLTLRGSALRSVAAYAPGGLNLTSDEGATRVRIAAVTPSFWPTLGVRPMIGRPFRESEGTIDAAKIVMLSHAIWQQHFGGDPAIVGKKVALNGVTHEVVGVMAPGFAFPAQTELWTVLPVPYSFGAMEAFRSFLPSKIVARLAPGVSIQTAAERVHALWAPYASSGRGRDRKAAEDTVPFHTSLVGQSRTALLVLLGATALVLLTACANAANLLLTRASARRREMALRTALGASRGRLVRQLLTESVLLAFAGAVVGSLLAWVSLDFLRLIMPATLLDVSPVRLDIRVLGVALGLAIVTGILFGIWPALGASRVDVSETMKAAGTGSATVHEGARIRRLFAVAELAMAVMLVVGATLMLRSFAALIGTQSGIGADHVGSMEITLSRARYATAVARRAFFDRVIDRLRATPGIEAAAVVNELPLRGYFGIALSYSTDRLPADPDAMPPFAQYLRVSADYFRALSIQLVAGRGFATHADTAVREIVINVAMAKKAFPGENPLGREIIFGGTERRTVVGIVADVRSEALDKPPSEQMYLPNDDSPSPFAAIVARGTMDEHRLLAALGDAVRAVDPAQPAYNLRMMDDVISGAIAARRTNTILIATFGAVALLLAAVGVYGVIAYGVTQRSRELGIRIALGARGRDVLGLVMREGAWIAGVGVTIGLAGAWWLSRVLESLVYGVSTRDPVAFSIAPVVLVAAALLATLLPARQAARLNPLDAIRAE